MRVLIADEHDIVRIGVRAILENSSSHEVCGEAFDIESTLDVARASKPDVIMLEYLPTSFGSSEVVVDIKKNFPDTSVMMLTGYGEKDLISETLQAGARAYLLKSEAVDHMLLALDAVARGKTYLSTAASTSLAEVWASGFQQRPMLTMRERQIIRLIAETCSIKDIAEKLNLSPKTVEAHKTSAMHKLKLRNIAELVRYAIRHRLIAP
ncbi:LuxR C-terminal-related transcriptional regulator [Methylobacterium sp. JK268]